MPGYITLAELKDHLGIGNTGDDSMLTIAIDAAEEAIDHHCGRKFDTTDTAVDGDKTSRLYTPPDHDWAWIDDAAKVDSVETRDDTDDDYATWDAGDWDTWPENAEADSRPLLALVAVDDERFNATYKSLRVTAWFGWPAVPDRVKEAALLQSARFFRRGESPFGVSQTPDLEGAGGMRLLAKLDADVQLMLSHLQRGQVL